MWRYHIIVLIVRTVWINYFLHLVRALCLCLDYDRPSRIFPCLLLTRNHMIFLVQFGINKHLLIFSKTTNCTRPTGSCNFVSLWKNLLVLIYSKLHSKSCDYLYKYMSFAGCTPQCLAILELLFYPATNINLSALANFYRRLAMVTSREFDFLFYL